MGSPPPSATIRKEGEVIIIGISNYSSYSATEAMNYFEKESAYVIKKGSNYIITVGPKSKTKQISQRRTPK